jgi:hypothetical protein
LDKHIADQGITSLYFYDDTSKQHIFFGHVLNKDSFLGYRLRLDDEGGHFIQDGKAIKVGLKHALEFSMPAIPGLSQGLDKLDWKRLGPKATLSAAVAVTAKPKGPNDDRKLVRFATPIVVAEVDTPKTN